MSYRHISTHDVHALRTSQPDTIIIDVREPHEYAIARIDGTILCPISTSASWIESFAKDAPIVVICHHGMRSEHVAAALTSRYGYTNVATMDGGIDDWSARIDPTIPRY
jgi:rhodanese-related sulfurtransferase